VPGLYSRFKAVKESILTQISAIEKKKEKYD
jgi:hypothetical protein